MTQGVNTKTHQLESFVGQSYDDLASSDDYDYVFVAEYEKQMNITPELLFHRCLRQEKKLFQAQRLLSM